MSLWFWEQMDMTGRWSPVTAPLKPPLKADRLKRSTSIGDKVRALKEVAPGHEGLSLDALQAIYGEK